MKIAVISSTVFPCPPPGYAGLEMIAFQIARGLAAKNHEVALIAPQGSHCPGVKVIATGPPGGWDEKTAYQSYWKELIAYDAIIDHSWQKWSLVLKNEGVLKAPILCVTHAPVDTMYRELPPVEKPCFVCISKDQADHFQALFGRPARHAYNGIDLEFYKPLGIPRTERFLFLARFSSIKGADLAIDVCKRAGVGLDLVGDTSITQEPDYFNRCKAQADGKQIKIIGPCSRGECVWWFSQAKALLHPNARFREPFGLAPVEAQACGCPVIAWNYGAMRETIDHRSTGALVSSLDDMEAALHWPINRQACREWAKQFSEQNMVNRYEELCLEAVQTGGW